MATSLPFLLVFLLFACQKEALLAERGEVPIPAKAKAW
jgi:hypothetical protein